MTDSQRLRTVPEGIRLISEVAGELARRNEGRTSVLAVATYLPMDVDSVARVFEGLEEISGIERVQEQQLTVYEIENVDRFSSGGADIGSAEFLQEAQGFLRAVGQLKLDRDWVRKVKEQHELLQIIAASKKTRLELDYLATRAKKPRARVQSILNDFDAEGYIGAEVDEDADQLFYTFPAFEYPKERLERNLRLLEEVEPAPRQKVSLWIFLAAFAIILLAIVVLLRF